MKTSPLPVVEGVGHAVAPDSVSSVISAKPRLPGVDSTSVFKALRGVSGGCMAFFSREDWLLEAWSATLPISSSSLAGQS